MRFPLAGVSFVVTGALAVWLTRTPWAAYWRSREFAADQYAARLGQAQALASFLDTNALANDLPVPFVWLTDQSHPATEHRIDRLFRPAR
jgi:Zn-dependent protease with chaperone function